MITSDSIPRAKGTSTAGRTRRQGGLVSVGSYQAVSCCNLLLFGSLL